MTTLREYVFHEEPGITLYCGDNRTILPLLEFPVGLILTSPPYNLGTSSGGGFQDIAKLEAKKTDRIAAAVRGHYPAGARLNARGGAGKWSGGALARGYGAHDDAMPHAEYVKWQHETLRACWAVLADTGAIYYNHKARVLDGMLVPPMTYVPEELAGFVRQEIIWARAGGVNFSPAFYVPTHERIVIIARRGFRLRDKAASGAGDVWYIPQAPDPEHPAPFPLKLATTAIETSGQDIVLDPFCGSGTTLQAAKNLGCAEAIGIEIEPRYCEIAVKRLRQEVLPLTVNP
ncbi:MAG TPA: site-specific DNA-methyltransferase [Terriglobales bacterium]|nr:site-specific DNA-methyltransferase [Terriglobales bacterium]